MRVLFAANPCVSSKKLVEYLEDQRFAVDYATSGDDCLELAELYDFDVVVLDLSLASPCGYDVLTALRDGGRDTPVLALWPDSAVEKRTQALQMGADDCMARPLDRSEFLARIQAIVRRAKGHARSVIQAGDLQIDLSRRVVNVGGQPLQMTHREFAIVELLGLHKGCVISRSVLMSNVYGEQDRPAPKIIDVYMSRLRHKIAEAGGRFDQIQTVWGRGFCLADGAAPLQVAA